MLRITFSPFKLKTYFNNRVRESCKSCKRYGKKSTCPPHVESVEYYRSVLCSYNHGMLFIEKFELKDYTMNTWQELGEYSSKVMQTALVEYKEILFNDNHFPTIFGAGSCKNCKKCTIPCRFPYKSIVPIEATGLNVVGLVSLIAKIGLIFPIKTEFYRVGMVLWD